MGNLTDEQINNLIKVAGLSIADLPKTHKELHRMIWDAYEAGTKVSQIEPEVKVNFAERIIEEEIEKLEKLANEYNEDMDTESYINNLNDSNILHRVLIRIKSESKISA